VSILHVAAGILTDPQGRVLIARRPDRAHQGGRWEFPGGKLEPGETSQQGLARELREELGVQVLASEPLIRIRHDYGDRQILLEVRRVTRFTGLPRGREGQPLRWLHPQDMDWRAFPAADRPVIGALRLPDRMLVTGPDPQRPASFLARLEGALQTGVRLVQLRTPGLSGVSHLELATAALELCARYRADLVINPPVDGVPPPPGAGLHLSSQRLRALTNRPLAEGRLVGASCHDARELAQAAVLGLDYALLSPVLATASHPQAVPLGWPRFADLVERALLPVYALGGLEVTAIPIARRHGAQGIAAIRGLWPVDGSDAGLR